MKQRILVMNGSRIIENDKDGHWEAVKVEKAGNVKPGIYNIHLASQADKGKAHDGPVIHADKDHVYQQVGKSFVKHDRGSFDKVPEIGSNSTIKYDNGRATTSAASMKLGRGIS